MSKTHAITTDLHADAQMLLFLHNREYGGLLKFIDAQYGLKFMMQQTGEAFEDCVDWCAQNAGGIDNARHVVFLLFDRYFLHLPKPVQRNLRYLAEEVGFAPRQTKLHELRTLGRAQIQRASMKAVTLAQAARTLFRWLLIDGYDRTPSKRA